GWSAAFRALSGTEPRGPGRAPGLNPVWRRRMNDGICGRNPTPRLVLYSISPMKDFYICDCTRHENKVVTSTFVVVTKQIKPKKSGEPYLALTLGDRSGQLEAKMWDNVEPVLEAFEQDDFLKVKGLINKYKQRFQLTIHKLRKLGESEIEFADYLPKTTKN